MQKLADCDVPAPVRLRGPLDSSVDDARSQSIAQREPGSAPRVAQEGRGIEPTGGFNCVRLGKATSAQLVL
jgi:hypothetical protein